jgi:glutathione S-transferase
MSFMLHNAPQSTCSQRVRFVLNAKKLPFTEVKLDLLAGDQLKPDYLALNPNGVVPTLEHDGAIVTDSSVIIEYLDEIAPARENFTPHDPVTRAKMRALMHYMDEMPAAAVRVPTFNLAFLPRFAAMSEEEFVAFAESKPLRKEFMLSMGRKGFPQRDMDAAMARLRRTYERMNAEWRTMASRQRDVAGGHYGHAGDRAHGRSRRSRRVAGLAPGRTLVRGDSRSSCLCADLLSWLVAHGTFSAPAQGSDYRSLITVCTTSPRARASATPSPRKPISASD